MIAVAFLVRYWLSVKYAWIKKEEESVLPSGPAHFPILLYAAALGYIQIDGAAVQVGLLPCAPPVSFPRQLHLFRSHQKGDVFFLGL